MILCDYKTFLWGFKFAVAYTRLENLFFFFLQPLPVIKSLFEELLYKRRSDDMIFSGQSP